MGLFCDWGPLRDYEYVTFTLFVHWWFCVKFVCFWS